jgi:hypothetical protein
LAVVLTDLPASGADFFALAAAFGALVCFSEVVASARFANAGLVIGVSINTEESTSKLGLMFFTLRSSPSDPCIYHAHLP